MTVILFKHAKLAANSSRFETYTICGQRGSGMICLNGAAARCAQVGDVVIIMAYALFSEEEARSYRPTVVLVDESNRVKEIRRVEYPGQIA